uniref:Zinc finger LSD1-type domain-containing protein n=1 Tax=Spongospora subterranea TaxID=70186 RepID=A0A0H5R8K6_9EUKA|eukprot:CRZ10458.1 hypothetical protein [Spongospora subterranea]
MSIEGLMKQQIGTMNCTQCKVNLAFPRGSKYVKCPECETVMTPDPPISKQTICIGCNALLSHPVNARYIQCPRCAVTFATDDPASNIAPQSPANAGPPKLKPLPSETSTSAIAPYVPQKSVPKEVKPQETVYCLKCSSLLQYPDGALYIQCPVCMSTQQPKIPHQSQCRGCSQLLSHPPNSIWIQCPKCFVCFNSRERALPTLKSDNFVDMVDDISLSLDNNAKDKLPQALEAIQQNDIEKNSYGLPIQ